MEFVIITGMSGAGKTTALHVLEDIGFYCVDNIPASLLPILYTLCSKSEDANMQRVAVVVDVRGTENYKMMNVALEQFKAAHKDIGAAFWIRSPIGSRTARLPRRWSLKRRCWCPSKTWRTTTSTPPICLSSSCASAS